MKKKGRKEISRYISVMMAVFLCITNINIPVYAESENVLADTFSQVEANMDSADAGSVSDEKENEVIVVEEEENSQEDSSSDKNSNLTEDTSSNDQNQNKEAYTDGEDYDSSEEYTSEENYDNSEDSEAASSENDDDESIDDMEEVEQNLQDGITNESGWEFDSVTGTLRIYPLNGLGRFTDTSYAHGNVKKVIIEKGICNIPDNAFKDCTQLVSVDIPDSVISIGNSAFYGCSSLKGLEIPDSVTSIGDSAYANCSSLKTIELPKAITEMSRGLLSGATSLEEVTIPEGITKIGDVAFKGCKNLKIVSLPSSMKEIGNEAFYEANSLEQINLSEGITKIGQYTFYQCNKLDEIAIPSTVTSMGASAISQCSALKTIHYNAKSVEDLDSSAITGRIAQCESLEKINIGDEVISVPGHFVYDCDSISDLVIPEGIQIIGGWAFYDCDGITELTIPSTVTKIGGCYSYQDYSVIKDCKNLKIMNYKAETVENSYGLVDGCENLTDVKIGEKVSVIPDRFLVDCDKITEFTIPENIIKIGEYALSNCDRICELTIPESVIMLGGNKSWTYAIYNCNGLTRLNYNARCASSEGVIGSCGQLKEIQIGETVKKLPSPFLSSCNAIHSVTIPENVEEILGKYSVISSCSGLEELNFYAILTSTGTAGVTKGCERLKTIHFGKDVTIIPKNFISECPGLDEIVIPEGVEEVGGSAFYNCSGIKRLTVPESLKLAGEKAFSGLGALEDIYYNSKNLSRVGWSAVFYDCNPEIPIKLHFGSNVEEIPGNYMRDCNISTVDFRNTEITCLGGDYTFSWCPVTDVWIPESVTIIDRDAFYYCSSNITIHSYDFNGDNASVAKQYAASQKFNFESLGMHTWDDDSSDTKTCVVCHMTNTNMNSMWDLDKLTGTLKIYPLNESGQFSDTTYPKESIQKVIIEKGILNIPDYAFKGCTQLTSVEIADSVTSIGNRAFSSCSSLEELEIPDSVIRIGNHAFAECYSLKQIQLSKKITEISDNLFYYASSLEEITIPEGVAKIEESAFYHCDNLKKVSLPSSMKEIGNEAFRSTSSLEQINLPEGITSIGDFAFGGCDKIEEITIPSTVTFMGKYAIINCNTLKTINYNAKSLDDMEYSDPRMRIYGCHSLENMKIGDDVVSIPNFFVGDCDNISEFVIPEGIQSIGSWAVHDCDGITELTIPSTVIKIGNFGMRSSIDNCRNLKTLNYNAESVEKSYGLVNMCENLHDVNIGGKVSVMPSNFLSNCDNISEFVIPEGITKIEGSVLTNCDGLTRLTYNATSASKVYDSKIISGCDNLKDVIIGENVKKIPNDFLANCNAIHSITIPENVEKILESGSIISNCSGLEELNFNAILPFPTGGGVVSECKNLKTIHFGKNVTVIPENFVERCQGVEEIDIPEGVRTIGDWAFRGCNGLKRLTIPESLLYAERNVFSELGAIEDIYYNAKCCTSHDPFPIFESCNPETPIRLHIGPNVKQLPDWFMLNCNISSLDLRDTNITEIGRYAFEHCPLSDVYIPETITNIDSNAFDRCPENFTIHGYDFHGDNASAAKQYAASAHYKFESLGMHTWAEPPLIDGNMITRTCTVCGKMYFDVIDDDSEASGSSHGSIVYTYNKSSRSYSVKGAKGSSKEVTYGKTSYITLAVNDCSITKAPSSSDSSVISVEKAGSNYRLVIKSAGDASIRFVVSNHNGNSEEKTLYIKVNPASQSINCSDLFTKVVGTKTFSLGASSSTGNALTYTSSNPKNIAVDANGNVTVRCKGTAEATIMIKCVGSRNYREASQSVKVKIVQKLGLKGKRKNLKASTLKKRNQVIFLKAYSNTNKHSFVLAKKMKGIKVSKSGKITVKKGLPKGKYILNLKVTAKAGTVKKVKYAAITKGFTYKIILK